MGAITAFPETTGPVISEYPVGAVIPYAGSTAPAGWLICDGTAISRTTYADLFNVIGTAFGVGDGSATFNLPNLKGRVPVGRDAADTDWDTLGETRGAKTHTLALGEIPNATGTIGLHGSASGSMMWSPAGVFSTSPIINGSYKDISPTLAAHSITELRFNLGGGGGAHNNLQPSIALNYIIRATPQVIVTASTIWAGLPYVCTSTTRPAAPGNGMMIWETDTKRLYVWDSAWVKVGGKPITTLGAGTGSTVNPGPTQMATLTLPSLPYPTRMQAKFYGLWSFNAADGSEYEASIRIGLNSGDPYLIMNRMIAGPVKQNLLMESLPDLAIAANSPSQFSVWCSRLGGSGTVSIPNDGRYTYFAAVQWPDYGG